MSERRSDSFYWARGEEMPPALWIPEFETTEVALSGRDWPDYIVEKWERNVIGELRFVASRTYTAIRAEADERVAALREAAQRVCDEADPDWGDEGWIDYLVPFAHVAALRAALDATAEERP